MHARPLATDAVDGPALVRCSPLQLLASSCCCTSSFLGCLSIERPENLGELLGN